MKPLSKFNRVIRDFLWLTGIIQFKIEMTIDNPTSDSIRERIIYVVGNEKYIKWAYLKCPSKCGDVIMLSLNKKLRPSWTVSQDKIGRPTIYPSIHKLDGCKSHFWLQLGNVRFV